MTDEEIKNELLRYLPVLERAEADPEIWEKLTQGLGIATLNGYKKAVSWIYPKAHVSEIAYWFGPLDVAPKRFNPRDRRKIFPLPE